MRVLVTGSRKWTDNDVIAEALFDVESEMEDQYEEFIIVHGDCPLGADRAARNYAVHNGIKEERHSAKWNEHGRAAGHIRNKLMVDTKPDHALVFIKGESKGTLNCLEHIKKAGIPYEIFTD